MEWSRSRRFFNVKMNPKNYANLIINKLRRFQQEICLFIFQLFINHHIEILSNYRLRDKMYEVIKTMIFQL